MKSKFAVHDDLIFEFSVVDILLPSLASGADDWPSRAIASKQTTNVKKEDQIFKLNMLQIFVLKLLF